MNNITPFYGGPFSQWYKCKFKPAMNPKNPDDAEEFSSAEQYMMYCKAKLFGDSEAMKWIMATDDPKVQKSLGRTVQNFDEEIWKRHREEIVFIGNCLKFGQNEELREELLNTGDSLLVEASPYDRVWGVGLSEIDPRIADPEKWQGDNLLGKVLMRVRESLKEQEDPSEYLSSDEYNQSYRQSVRDDGFPDA